MENEEPGDDTLFDRGRAEQRLKGSRRGLMSSGRGRWLTTAALCASFLGLGMCIAVIGPTFEDLALNVHKNISNMSYIFAGRSAGYIGGSLLGGTLLECLNPYLLLGLSMLLTAVGMCAIPLCRNILLLTGLMACIGISMGTLDTGGNVLLLNTWAEKAGPHMQALHFSFSAGAFLSPIIAQLLFEAHGNRSSPAENATARAALEQSWGHMRSMWAYVIIGLFVLLTAVFFFLLFCCRAGSRNTAYSVTEQPQVARHHKAIIALLFFFFFAYVGAEVAYGSFIFTFSKDFAGLGEVEAAGINSVFWGCFAACRGLAILLAACISPGALITMSLVYCCASSLLLSVFPHQRAVLWAGSGLYGASMAAVFPSGLSWVEQYTPVTGRTAAVFVVGAALGEMVLPVLLGFLLGQFGGVPLLMYQALACAALCSVLFPAMYRLALSSGVRERERKGRRGGKKTEFCRALLQPEDEDDDDDGDDDFEMESSHCSHGDEHKD